MGEAGNATTGALDGSLRGAAAGTPAGTAGGLDVGGVLRAGGPSRLVAGNTTPRSSVSSADT